MDGTMRAWLQKHTRECFAVLAAIFMLGMSGVYYKFVYAEDFFVRPQYPAGEFVTVLLLTLITCFTVFFLVWFYVLKKIVVGKEYGKIILNI